MQWFDYIKLKQFKEKILSEDIGLKKITILFTKMCKCDISMQICYLSS